MSTNDMVALMLTGDDLLVRLNGQTLFRQEAVINHGPDGELVTGLEAHPVPEGSLFHEFNRVKEPARHCVQAGVIADLQALKLLLAHVGKLTAAQQATVALVVVVLPDRGYDRDRAAWRDLVKEPWGADVKVMVRSESQLTIFRSDAPFTGSRGAFLGIIGPSYTTCAVYAKEKLVVSSSHAVTSTGPISSKEERLKEFAKTVKKTIDEAGTAYTETLKSFGLTVLNVDKVRPGERLVSETDLKKELSVDRFVMYRLTANAAILDVIANFEASKEHYISTWDSGGWGSDPLQ
ncbi:hypothetical protein AB0O91_30325 [Kitasatospora sp. NPDC089797]|uniref:hypothetical protein n=1 Tax=Kitasatospora sp. NPDC089797 TaxID=3155298 RepID=UPI0034197799